MEAFKNTHDSHINKEEFIRSVTNNKCELEVVLPRSKT